MSPMNSRTAAAGEGGFSLVEVVVALGILAVVATAALSFFTRTLAADVALQHRETAVALANAAMEQVRVVDPEWSSPAATVEGGQLWQRQRDGLVAGRTKDAVRTAWNASSFPEKSLTVPAYDEQATSSSTTVVPITPPATRVSDQTFTTTVLIGACARARSAGSSGCTAALGGDVVYLQRVVVEVRWTSVTGSCTDGGCVYRTTALIDPNADATWLKAS